MQKEYRNDRAWLTLSLEADLRSVFHWNTKQVPNAIHDHALAFQGAQFLCLSSSPCCCKELVLVCQFACVCMQAFVYITADFKTAQNTVNEVMIWSRIVQEKRNADMNELVRLEYPYALTDPSKEKHCSVLAYSCTESCPCCCALCNISLIICCCFAGTRLACSNPRMTITEQCLTCVGYSMRNLTFDLHLDWETVPVVGMLHRSRQSFREFVFPREYFRTKAIPRNSNSGW